MNELSHTIGRDPVMDRAVANVARSLDAFQAAACHDIALAERLALASRRLWGATTRLTTDADPARFTALREEIRDLVVDCKEAEHVLHQHCAEPDPASANSNFARVVRRYRAFLLADQARRYGERMQWGQS